MQLLDTPLRITWELSGAEPSLDVDQAQHVAGEIADAGVLFVTLDGQPLHHPASRRILELLTCQGAQVLAVVDSPHNLSRELPLQRVALDAASCLGVDRVDFNELATRLEQVRDCGYEPLLWLAAFKSYLAEIPELLRFCMRHGVGRIKLSNLPLHASVERTEAVEIPRPDDLSRHAEALQRAAAETIGHVALEIHDRFLWEVMADDASSLAEYGGCQAANSLGHIDAQGDVYPCSSWPERLGSLLSESLDEIWASEARQVIRRSVATIPDGCSGCRDYQECFAGCRGLSACLDFSNLGRDPLCSGCR